jgi:hypothetical protein
MIVSLDILFSILSISLTTLFATVFGVVFSAIFALMMNKTAREHMLVLLIGRLAKVIDVNKIYNLLSGISAVIAGVLKTAEKSNTNTTSVATLDGNILKIPFTYGDKEYVYRTVHSHRLARNPKKYLARKDQVKVDLNHYSGIEMVVTAEDLGVDEIIKIEELADIFNI